MIAAKRKTIRKTGRSATRRAPLVVRHLIQSIDETQKRAGIDAAYAAAHRVIGGNNADSRRHRLDNWVETQAVNYIDEYAGEIARELTLSHDGGTIQSAFMDPSFALGFCVAYELLKDGVK